jgi:asparagine synthase (glutamine-hydrolysing)
MVMYRYMALMWSRADREADRAAKFLAANLPEVSPHAWSQAWDGAGLAIYHSGEHKGRMQTYRLQGERGAVLGRLFRNDYTSVVDDLDEFESRKCLETRGQRLIDDYWGRYVAFLNDPETGTRYVMRDPTGAFPCFHTPFRGVTIYFSDMQDAANFDFLPFTVNWEFIKANFFLPQYQKTITGLNEVSEVLPAECLEVTPFEKKSRFVWNPTEISQTGVVEDPEEAAALLRETVKSTIGAIAGCYDRVIHNLGGLDSSIALACMAQAQKRPEIICATHFTRSTSGDERLYSRQVVRKCDVELIEWELDWRKADLSRIFESNKLARPLGFFDCIGLTGDVLALAKKRDAEALTYGVGGDQVYFQLHRNFGALDYVRQHGLFQKDILKVAIEASRYGRKSLFATLRDMIRELAAPAPCYRYVHNEIFQFLRLPFIDPEFVDESGHERLLHPLLIPDDRDPKGKYKHILGSALSPLEHYNHWDAHYYAEQIRMYFTQPIIETCLRIPGWVMTYGAIDRGLARKAFQCDLPEDIVKRLSKSSPQTYYDEIFIHNKDYVMNVLLDGVMAREGILLHDKLEQGFTGQDQFLQVKSHEMLKYLSIEVWLRRWMERPVRQASSLALAV